MRSLRGGLGGRRPSLRGGFGGGKEGGRISVPEGRLGTGGAETAESLRSGLGG